MSAKKTAKKIGKKTVRKTSAKKPATAASAAGALPFREIFKWGDPAHEEQLKEHVVEFLEEHYPRTGARLKSGEKFLAGFEPVRIAKKGRLKSGTLAALRKIVGASNVSTDDVDRARHSAGKFFTELLELRLGRVPNPPDAVVFPRNEKEVAAVLQYCQTKKIPVIPFGGGSSVTGGLSSPRGGIALNLTRHMNKVISLNEINESVTVQAGMYGPALETYLNERGYTCGHFPQSFEYSTVGGWSAARGAGQASTGYGTMAAMVLGQRLVSPAGTIATRDFPTVSLGPDLDGILVGSEGVLGALTEVTMKVRKYRPDDSKLASFMFPDFEAGVDAMREVMQGGFAPPHFFRLQDSEETELSFQMAGMSGGKSDKFLRLLGYRPMERSLMHVIAEGDADQAKLVVKKIAKIARRHGAFATGSGPVKKWLEQRYSSAYLRDPLMDAGIAIDTLETAVRWDDLMGLWTAVREYIKKRPDTFCLVHISHAYENGAMLYAIFMTPLKECEPGDRKSEAAMIDDFVHYHRGIIETIRAHGGSLSHHHGVGRMLAPWLRDEIGAPAHDLLRAIKKQLDPKGIMNPGALDLK